jgi:transaldolase
MKIFLDTADYDAISMRYDTGLIDGVTTNPSLIKKSGDDPFEAIKAISESFPKLQSISAEVVADVACDMVEQAKPFMELDNVTIKVPCTVEGLRACRQLRDLGATVNVTLIFSASQAVLAAKAGATYVSPFIGRLDDISSDGLELIESIREIYNNYEFSTEILAASVRHTMHIIDCARIGADVMTGPLSAILGLLKHPLTDIGLEKFLADHAKAQG